MTWSDPAAPGRIPPGDLLLPELRPLGAAAAGVRPDTDYWVSRFFDDLADAVAARCHEEPATSTPASSTARSTPGADFKATLTDALSVAEVFVPLLLTRLLPPTRGRWASRSRSAAGSPGRARRRPTAPGAGAVAAAAVLGRAAGDDPGPRPGPDAGDRADYAENGLRALCKLGAYRGPVPSWSSRRWRTRIVTVTETQPLARSRAPGRRGVRPARRRTASPPGAGSAADRSRPAGRTQRLVGAVRGAARTARRRVRRQRPPSGSGCPPVSWTSAAARGLSIGEPRRRAAVDRARPDAAGVLAGAGRPAAAWVVPLVIADDDDERGATAGPTEVAAAVAGRRVPPGDAGMQHRRVRRRCMPALVTEARRQFLRYGPVVPAGPARTRSRACARPGPSTGRPPVRREPAAGAAVRHDAREGRAMTPIARRARSSPSTPTRAVRAGRWRWPTSPGSSPRTASGCSSPTGTSSLPACTGSSPRSSTRSGRQHRRRHRPDPGLRVGDRPPARRAGADRLATGTRSTPGSTGTRSPELGLPRRRHASTSSPAGRQNSDYATTRERPELGQLLQPAGRRRSSSTRCART